MWMPRFKSLIRDRRRTELAAIYLVAGLATAPDDPEGGGSRDAPDDRGGDDDADARAAARAVEDSEAAIQERVRTILSRHERDDELWLRCGEPCPPLH